MPVSVTDRSNDQAIDGRHPGEGRDGGAGGGSLTRGWGGGEGGQGSGGNQPVEPERTPPPEGYRIGMWLAITCVSLLFVSLNVLYTLNNAGDKTIATPAVLWASTGLILLSSLSIEFARRALRQRQEDRFRLLLCLTLALGIAFLIAQLVAWQSLQSAGFYLAGNFRASFAYIFTALHGLHLVGGLGGLLYILLRRPATWTRIRRRVSVDITTVYWHFLCGLWIYIWILIFVWK
ncbi:MAG: hypothetical protein EBU88_01775 [Acidobacteria bacterium]|nr:hypothetical protein [Acidobacteriota bacterium]